MASPPWFRLFGSSSDYGGPGPRRQLRDYRKQLRNRSRRTLLPCVARGAVPDHGRFTRPFARSIAAPPASVVIFHSPFPNSLPPNDLSPKFSKDRDSLSWKSVTFPKIFSRISKIFSFRKHCPYMHLQSSPPINDSNLATKYLTDVYVMCCNALNQWGRAIHQCAVEDTRVPPPFTRAVRTPAPGTPIS
jgi:hypothetical protein